MKILAIDTSADDTSAAITQGRIILSNISYSQIALHAKWGGIFPTIAKRAHIKMIEPVIQKALQKAKVTFKNIDAIAITYGPGLAPALQIGIQKAQEIAKINTLPIIPVNHIEGHIYSAFAQNRNKNPKREFTFPFLAIVVSGGHTEFIIVKKHVSYTVVGYSVDDAAGEALDKGARLLVESSYPGGPVIEKLSLHGNNNYHIFPRAMMRDKTNNMSFSGLKTSLKYYLDKKDTIDKLNHINDIAASYQEAVFKSIIKKLNNVISVYSIKCMVGGGGVMANNYLRKLLQDLSKNHTMRCYLTNKKLCGDNAAMIGIAAYYKAKNNIILPANTNIDRVPRANLSKLEYS